MNVLTQYFSVIFQYTYKNFLKSRYIESYFLLSKDWSEIMVRSHVNQLEYWLQNKKNIFKNMIYLKNVLYIYIYLYFFFISLISISLL